MSQHNSALGREVVYDDATQSLNHTSGGSLHGGGGNLAPTLVGTAGHLQFDLIWDSSVGNAPNGFKTDVIHTATYLANLFTTDEIINVHVGWGEINGRSLSSGDLGESQTNGYLQNYAAVASELGPNLHPVSNDPTGAQFFISSAEAKAFGLISPTSTAVDGSVAFGAGYSWNMNYGANGVGTSTSSAQYDLQPVILHELTEVMGRISMEGGQVFNGKVTYTALDLFDYNSSGVLELSGSGGYYSDDGGNTALGTFNNASLHGGLGFLFEPFSIWHRIGGRPSGCL